MILVLEAFDAGQPLASQDSSAEAMAELSPLRRAACDIAGPLLPDLPQPGLSGPARGRVRHSLALFAEKGDNCMKLALIEQSEFGCE